jgi:hypothetical protein
VRNSSGHPQKPLDKELIMDSFMKKFISNSLVSNFLVRSSSRISLNYFSQGFPLIGKSSGISLQENSGIP